MIYQISKPSDTREPLERHMEELLRPVDPLEFLRFEGELSPSGVKHTATFLRELLGKLGSKEFFSIRELQDERAVVLYRKDKRGAVFNSPEAATPIPEHDGGGRKGEIVACEWMTTFYSGIVPLTTRLASPENRRVYSALREAGYFSPRFTEEGDRLLELAEQAALRRREVDEPPKVWELALRALRNNQLPEPRVVQGINTLTHLIPEQALAELQTFGFCLSASANGGASSDLAGASNPEGLPEDWE